MKAILKIEQDKDSLKVEIAGSKIDLSLALTRAVVKTPGLAQVLEATLAAYATADALGILPEEKKSNKKKNKDNE